MSIPIDSGADTAPHPEVEIVSNEKTEAAYGRWTSPITPEMITKGKKGYGEPHVDGQVIYWKEARPDEEDGTLAR